MCSKDVGGCVSAAAHRYLKKIFLIRRILFKSIVKSSEYSLLFYCLSALLSIIRKSMRLPKTRFPLFRDML